MMVSKNSSQPSVLANFGNGRLGNQMCNFASQYALHKEYEVLSYFSKSSLNTLKEAFQLPKSSGRNSSYYKWNDKCIKARDIDWAYISNAQLIQPKKRKRLFEYLKKSYYIKLETYVCDIKGFLPYVQDLRKYIFRFKSKDISQAQYNLSLRHP